MLTLPSSDSQILKSTNNHPKGFRVVCPMRSDKTQSFTQVPEGQVGLEVNINNHKITATKLYGNNVITALVGNHMCNNCSIRQEILMNADSRSACVQIIRYERSV